MNVNFISEYQQACQFSLSPPHAHPDGNPICFRTVLAALLPVCPVRFSLPVSTVNNLGLLLTQAADLPSRRHHMNHASHISLKFWRHVLELATLSFRPVHFAHPLIFAQLSSQRIPATACTLGIARKPARWRLSHKAGPTVRLFIKQVAVDMIRPFYTF